MFVSIPYSTLRRGYECRSPPRSASPAHDLTRSAVRRSQRRGERLIGAGYFSSVYSIRFEVCDAQRNTVCVVLTSYARLDCESRRSYSIAAANRSSFKGLFGCRKSLDRRRSPQLLSRIRANYLSDVAWVQKPYRLRNSGPLDGSRSWRARVEKLRLDVTVTLTNTRLFSIRIHLPPPWFFPAQLFY